MPVSIGHRPVFIQQPPLLVRQFQPFQQIRAPQDFLLITPGIRPLGAASGDQTRIATPGAAMKAGADLLVIGRPISEAPDAREAVEKIVAEMA